MKTKALALLEAIIATLLMTVLVLASVGVLEAMQRETVNFQHRVRDDMNWVECDRHLAQMVRTSSFIRVPNTNTLELYGYGGNPSTGNGLRGTYFNDIVNRRINYTLGTAITRFQNTTGTFAAVGAQKEGRDVEVRIDYDRPFRNILNLACRVDVKIRDPWEIRFTTSPQIRLSYAMPTVNPSGAPDGHIAVGTVTWPASPPRTDLYVIKVDKKGNKVWDRDYRVDTGASLDNASICETTNISGVYDGFILGGSYRDDSANPTTCPFLMKIDLGGNTVAFAYRYGGNRYYNMKYSIVGLNATRTWNSSSVPDGFILCGRLSYIYTITGITLGTHDTYYLIKTDMDGKPTWSNSYSFECDNNRTNPGLASASVGVTPAGDGFILCSNIQVSGKAAACFLKINSIGRPAPISPLSTSILAKAFTAGNSCAGIWLQGAVVPVWSSNGYILGTTTPADGGTPYPCLIRLDNNFNYIWSRTYPAYPSIYLSNTAVNEAFTSFFTTSPDGWTAMTPHGVLLRLNDDGTIRPRGISQLPNPPSRYSSLYNAYSPEGAPDGLITAGNDALMKTDKDGNLPTSQDIDIVTELPVPTSVTFGYKSTAYPVELSPNSLDVSTTSISVDNHSPTPT